MCLIGSCPGVVTYNLFNSVGRGLSVNAICDAHYNALKTLMQTAYPTLTGTMLDDCVALKVLMLDTATAEQQLVYLNEAMQAIDHLMGPAPNGPRLGRTLTPYETKCYFPDFLIIPLGYIEKGFDNLGRSGFVATKDPGAGVGHGKYTHRVQWHIVMRVITDQFRQPIRANWSHSPLDLFLTCCSTVGKIGPGASMRDESTNLFGYIFDLGKRDIDRRNYGFPDDLFTEMRDQLKYGSLGRSTTKNFMKRQAEDMTWKTTPAVATMLTAESTLKGLREQRDGAPANNMHPAYEPKSGPSRWILNSKVGKAKQAYNEAKAAAPPNPNELKRTTLLGTGNWEALGTLPDSDPFGNRAPGADFDYGDAILMPTGAVRPSPLDLAAARGNSITRLNPAINLPTLGARGHA